MGATIVACAASCPACFTESALCQTLTTATGDGRKQLIPPSLTSAHTTHMVLPQARLLACFWPAGHGTLSGLPLPRLLTCVACTSLPSSACIAFIALWMLLAAHPFSSWLHLLCSPHPLSPPCCPRCAARQLHWHYLWRPGDAVDGAVRLHRCFTRRPRRLPPHRGHGLHFLPQPHTRGGHGVCGGTGEGRRKGGRAERG